MSSSVHSGNSSLTVANLFEYFFFSFPASPSSSMDVFDGSDAPLAAAVTRALFRPPPRPA